MQYSILIFIYLSGRQLFSLKVFTSSKRLGLLKFFSNTFLKCHNRKGHPDLPMPANCINDVKSNKERLRQQFLNTIQTASYFSLIALSIAPSKKGSLVPNVMNPPNVDAVVKGYKTVVAQSVYSPGKILYGDICPVLPQSALLNSLNYIDTTSIYDLISEMQNYLESFIQLINPTYKKQIKQISSANSTLWKNLRLNAQRAAGMFIYNRDEIFLSSSYTTIEGNITRISDQMNNSYVNTLSSADSFRTDSEMKQKSQYRQRYLNNLKYDVLNLVRASERSDVIECLRYMRNSLNSLLEVAYLYTPFSLSSLDIAIETDPPYVSTLRQSSSSRSSSTLDSVSSVSAEFDSNTDEFLISNNQNFDDRALAFEKQLELRNQLARLPRLVGRARVTLYLQRPGSDSPILRSNNTAQQTDASASSKSSRSTRLVSDGSSKKNLISTVKLVVDGINHPYTAGNFIDLCQKGFYDNTVIAKTLYSSGGRGGTSGDQKQSSDAQNRALPIETKKFYKSYSNNSQVTSSIFPSSPQSEANSNELPSNDSADDTKDSIEREKALERIERERLKDLSLNSANMTIFGSHSVAVAAGGGAGYMDPSSSRIRRVPMEILRQKDVSKSKESNSASSITKKSPFGDNYVYVDNSRYIATGLLHNTAFFTKKAKPVLSFGTYGAIGMYHSKQDGNGASSSFFYVSPQSELLNLFERHTSPVIDRLNNYYSLFAYVIEGLDVLEQLREGDVLISTIIEDNAWELEQPSSKD